MATVEEMKEALAAKRKQMQIDERFRRANSERRRESIKRIIKKTSSRLLIKGKKTRAARPSKRRKLSRAQPFKKSSARLRAPEFKVKKYGFNF